MGAHLLEPFNTAEGLIRRSFVDPHHCRQALGSPHHHRHATQRDLIDGVKATLGHLFGLRVLSYFVEPGSRLPREVVFFLEPAEGPLNGELPQSCTLTVPWRSPALSDESNPGVRFDVVFVLELASSRPIES